MSIRINAKAVRISVFFLLALFICATLVFVENSISYESFMGFLIVFVLVLANAIWIRGWKVSQNIRAVIYMGYALYILLSFVQTYVTAILPGFMANSDQQPFWNIAQAYLQGNYDKYRTNFPYLIRFLFSFVGKNEFAIRMLNIECVLLGAYLLTKAGGYLSGRTDQILMAFYMLNPWNLMIYTQILREPYKHIFLMICVYLLLKWMKKRELKYIAYSVLSAVPLLWLHNGEVGILAVILITYVFWMPGKQQWGVFRLTWKTVLIFLLIVFFPQIYGVFTALFPGKFSGTFSLKYLVDKATVMTDGRTTYIPQITISSPVSFMFWSIYRMFYFWVSPTPRFWSSVNDVIMFAVDTVPWIAFCIYMIKKMKWSGCDNRCKLVIPFFLFMTFIFAWGTINAGTAMRHRDHFIGVMVMLALLKDKDDKGACYHAVRGLD